MRVGITFCSFDLLHAGHVMMFKEAQKKCDYLIVGLQQDPSLDRSNKNAPLQSIIETYIQLKGHKYLNEIIPYLLEQDIDVSIIVEEYQTIDFKGKKHCTEKGIAIYYNS